VNPQRTTHDICKPIRDGSETLKELETLKKKNVEEMEALQVENSRIRQKLEDTKTVHVNIKKLRRDPTGLNENSLKVIEVESSQKKLGK